jgi:hypothetical protein
MKDNNEFHELKNTKNVFVVRINTSKFITLVNEFPEIFLENFQDI